MDRSLRIAIADDEPDIRRFYERSLRRQGHEIVVSVENGRELLDECRVHTPDLIITDVMMPVMDGISVTRQFSAEHLVPVIVVSSRDPTDFDDYGDHKHVFNFLTKPVNTAQLVDAVSEAAGCGPSRRTSEM